MSDAPATCYTMYAVFAGPLRDAAEPQSVLDTAVAKGVTTRGSYDVSGYRADADLLVWLVAPDVDALQDTYRRLRGADGAEELEPVWSAVGVHRDAEFNRDHKPAFVMGEQPRRYLCVYPFVRSYEWYLLPPEERAEMLREHGQLAAPYPDVRANTVASFALSDYEWLLAFEADEAHRIVDLMRALRAAKARRHTREEVPFFFGVRKPLADLVG
jgi:chlorite dismutase